MVTCAGCGRLLTWGGSVGRAGDRWHPRCIVRVLLAAPRQSPETTRRILRDLVPAGMR